MRPYNIHLKEMTDESNRAFLQSLFQTTKLEEVVYTFDRTAPLDVRGRLYVTDLGMTIENYLNLVGKLRVALQINAEVRPGQIHFGSTSDDKTDRTITRMAYVDCPLNEKNYDIVSELFSAAYAKKLEEYEDKTNKNSLYMLRDFTDSDNR